MVDEFTKRRWDVVQDPNKHKPVDALRVLADKIEAGEYNITHIVIAYTEGDSDEDPDARTGFFQAGNETHFGSLGLLARAMQIMGEGG